MGKNSYQYKYGIGRFENTCRLGTKLSPGSTYTFEEIKLWESTIYKNLNRLSNFSIRFREDTELTEMSFKVLINYLLLIRLRCRFKMVFSV